MNILYNKLIKLINEGKTLNQISNALNIPNDKIYSMLYSLKKHNYNYQSKYYDTGDIKFINNVEENNNEISIITDIDSYEYKALLISDIHYGSNFEALNIMNKMYDFLLTNNIHNIICTGDLLDGTYSREEQRIKNPLDQIEYLINKYPYDPNIITFTILGDHDYSILDNTNIDLIPLLKKYRYDIVPIGYSQGIINIKNDHILLKHPINNFYTPYIESNIVLKGHSHLTKITHSANNCHINIPSLSNSNQYIAEYRSSDRKKPAAYLMNLIFNNNIICQIELSYIEVSNKPHITNKISIAIPSTYKGNFNNIEKYCKKLKK